MKLRPITPSEFDRLENRIAAFLAAGIEVQEVMDQIATMDEAAKFSTGLRQTHDEMANLRQSLRPRVRR